MLSKIKNKIFAFIIKRNAKKTLKGLDKLVEKRENYFKDVEKDPNSFWYVKK